MHDTLPLLENSDFPAIRRKPLTTLQVNLGYLCNQSCLHCHVNAGPNRVEMMDEDTLALIPRVLAARSLGTLDLTGGAPELHRGFRALVKAAREQGVRVIDRCNLTILFEPGQEDLAEFLQQNRVEIVASMPCHSAANVDRQRGDGVLTSALQRCKSSTRWATVSQARAWCSTWFTTRRGHRCRPISRRCKPTTNASFFCTLALCSTTCLC